MKTELKFETYTWCAESRQYVLEKSNPAILVGMLKAKRLALKGVESSSLIRLPYVNGVKAIEVSA